MRTNELIEQLATELTAVHPLRPSPQRAAGWILAAFVYMGVLAFLVSQFSVASGGLSPALLVSQGIGVVAGVAAAFAAFASTIPGYSRKIMLLPAVAIVVWLAVFLFGATSGDITNLFAASHEWACVAIIVIGGAPLMAVLGAMLRKGAPLNPMLTGLLGALAVGLIANFSACISLPHESIVVTLAWHGGALLLLAGAGVAGARWLLRWR